MMACFASPDGPEIREVGRPAPKRDEVLVRVHAAGLNRADLAGTLPRALPTLGKKRPPLGLEWAGEVVEVGRAVREFAPGDRVMCSGQGGYAEYAVTDYGRVLPVPDNNMSWEQAAGLPIALLTAHDALVTHGRLAEGEVVLIQGASSGVGLMALQIAKKRGARLVIGSSTNEARRARLPEFGADFVIDSTDPDWPDKVMLETGPIGVDVIMDMISGGVAIGNLKAAAVRGRIVNVGRLGGMTGEFDFDLHAYKRLDYIGVTFRTRSMAEVRKINRRMQEDLWEAMTDGRLTLPVDSTFPLADAKDAQAHMSANAHVGKIILTMDG